jgi:hypothetical protein
VIPSAREAAEKEELMAYDHEKDVELSGRDLKIALEVMDKIHPPDLKRPKTDERGTKTAELVDWAIRVYVFSAFCQFREILQSTLTLMASRQIPVVFLCCRGLFEIAAHVYYVKDCLTKPIDEENWGAAWDLLLQANFGNRHRFNQQKATRKGGLIDYPDSIPINKAIKVFNQYFPDGAKLRTAEDEYGSLSEFCHPNSDAFTNHHDWEPRVNESVVKFEKPVPTLLYLALPSAALACSGFLESGGELLLRCGETVLLMAFEEFHERSATARRQ